MPTIKELTVSDFIFFDEEMKKMGYRQKTYWEHRGDFSRLGLEAPRFIKGREATYIFTANGLNSILHSTFDVVNQKWREAGEDMVWPLITKGDIARYFSKPLKRTENVITQALRRAWVNRYKVIHCPRCSQCKRNMEIMEKYKVDHETGEKKPTGQYYWGCFNMQAHKDEMPEFRSWDKVGPEGQLPKKAKLFVELMRRRVASYKKRNKELGINRTPMRKIRKKWTIKNPQNQKI